MEKAARYANTESWEQSRLQHKTEASFGYVWNLKSQD